MMELNEIVMKLIGPVNPVGETRTDDERFENLKQLCELVDSLVVIIDKVTPNERRHEFSMKRAGEYASNFLTHNLGIPE